MTSKFPNLRLGVGNLNSLCHNGDSSVTIVIETVQDKS